MKLLVASGNAKKIVEIQAILEKIIDDVQVLSLADLYDPIPDIPETGATFEENALIKARWLHERRTEWILADDSGLVVDALGGAPGIFSARYAGEQATSEQNIDKLLNELSLLPKDHTWSAHFNCVMALIAPNGNEYLVSGQCHGRITETKSGTKGFGYDPVFIPDGYTNSFADLDKEIKNEISHRGIALSHLSDQLYTIFSKKEEI